MNALKALTLAAALFGATACSTTQPPLATVAHVELERFMGDWHVIARIPTFLERGAQHPVEPYRLHTDGTMDTTFTFNHGAFDGPKKRYNPRGFVVNTTTNAVWGMRFVWPIKTDYRIVHVSDDYSKTIVGREARDYVWIMA